MEQIDYACGINCPEGMDDEQMLMEHVIRENKRHTLQTKSKQIS